MLLKVLVYGCYKYLFQPEIGNRFRGIRLKNALRSVFKDVVKLFAEEGLLSIEEVNTG
jgi:hypothetical protein